MSDFRFTSAMNKMFCMEAVLMSAAKVIVFGAIASWRTLRV